MNTQLFIENSELDVSDELSALLTFALDDVKDFASRQTTFSKTVTLPGTNRNNALFGNIFDLGVSNEYVPLNPNYGINFNPSVSAKCLMFQDNIQAFKGNLRLLEIIVTNGRKEYQVALNGELTNLSASLSTHLLEELDFSEYDTNFTKEAIVNSWDAPAGSGLYFPLVDYGTYSSDKHNWDIRTFRPALHVKEIIDKMFAQVNYTYRSNFFGSDIFKRLIIPYNKKVFQGLTREEFSASRSNNSNWLDQSTIFTRQVQFNTTIGTLFTPSISNSRFTYVGASPLTAHFTFSAGNRITRSVTNFYIEVWLNGVVVPGSTQHYPPDSNTSLGFYSYAFVFDYTINPGDYLELVTRCDAISSGSPDLMQVNNAGMGCTSVAAVLAPVGVGDFFAVNQGIPSNIRQVDFLKSIVQMFNLYVTESTFDERKMIIEPFINFFDGNNTKVVDWTFKMDRNGPISIKPMSELNSKLYKFIYKDDTDYYNDLYKKRYNLSYGSLIFDSQFEFSSAINSLELLFASTPLVGYDREDKVYPTIFKRTGSTTGVGEENVDCVTRIMLRKKVSGVAAWTIKDGATDLISLTSYGYAGHFDDPEEPGFDLNFGQLDELFFAQSGGDLSMTLFNVYWSAYMAEITNKDSKLLTAKFYLTPIDIFNLNFSHYVFVDGILYRLNKITDYNASKPATCEVQLLKVINTSYTFFTTPPIIGSFDWVADTDSGTEYFIDSDGSKIRYQ